MVAGGDPVVVVAAAVATTIITTIAIIMIIIEGIEVAMGHVVGTRVAIILPQEIGIEIKIEILAKSTKERGSENFNILISIFEPVSLTVSEGLQ